MPLFDLNKKFWQWFVMLLLAFIWGSSFILMKKGLDVFNANEVASVRIFISFLVLLPIALRKLKGIQSSEWKYLLIVGLCGTGIPAFMFATAQTHINSSLAGMLNSLVPLFTLLLGLLVFGLRYPLLRIIGVIVGLLGAAGLLGLGQASGEASDWKYGLLIVFSTICYATSVNVIKKHLTHLNSLAITAVSIMIVGLPVGIYLFMSEFTDKISAEPAVLWALAAVLALGIFGTAFAIIVFNMLIKKVSPLFAASVTYLIPIVAIFWGLVDGESVRMVQFLSMGVILTGVYLVNKA